LIVLLADALAALPEAEADVLWLYHAESLSFEAIGERVGLSRKAIRGIWARGLKHLRPMLEGPPGGRIKYSEHGANTPPIDGESDWDSRETGRSNDPAG
jgi:RNA polymerase sigma-70 factor (ECF subfamily)